MDLLIINEKSSFYQWDTGQKLRVKDADGCREVHFCTRAAQAALVVPIMERDGRREVDVPNILLQEDASITAYLYSYATDGAETRFAKNFQVLRRPKPDSYVYTETEVLNYSSLVARIDEIEKNGIRSPARSVPTWLRIQSPRKASAPCLLTSCRRLSTTPWPRQRQAANSKVIPVRMVPPACLGKRVKKATLVKRERLAQLVRRASKVLRVRRVKKVRPVRRATRAIPVTIMC